MTFVNLVGGEADIYGATQMGIFAPKLANIHINNTNSPEYRCATKLLFVLRQNTDQKYTDFYLSKRRKMLITAKSNENNPSLLIIEIWDTLNLQVPLRSFEMYLHTEYSRLEFFEVDNYINDSLELASNHINGDSGIFITGGEETLIIDDDIKTGDTKKLFYIIAGYDKDKRAQSILAKGLTSFSIYQQRFVCIQTNVSETSAGYIRFLLTQKIRFSTLGKLDNFSLKAPDGSIVSAIESTFDIELYLATHEYLFKLAVILGAIYVTSNKGVHLIRSPDVQNEIITIENVMHEQVSYADTIYDKCVLFNGFLTYATTNGVRVKSPYSTQQGSEELGDMAAQVLSSIGNINRMYHSPTDHRLLLLLTDGSVRAISEGTMIGGNAKSFPLSTYIENDKFTVKGITCYSSTKSVYYLEDNNNEKIIFVCIESDEYTPLCDVVTEVTPEAYVLDAKIDQDGSKLIFDSGSAIAQEDVNDVWVYVYPASGWINFGRIDFCTYVNDRLIQDISLLRETIVKYIPNTPDIATHFPWYYSDPEGITFSYELQRIIRNREEWYTPALKIEFDSVDGTDEVLIGKKVYDFTRNSYPAAQEVALYTPPNYSNVTYIYSAFFNTDDLIRNGRAGTPRYTQCQFFNAQIGYVKSEGMVETNRANCILKCGFGLNEVAKTLRPVQEFGGAGSGDYQARGMIIENQSIKTRYAYHSQNSFAENSADTFALLPNLNWVYIVFNVNLGDTTNKPANADVLLYYNGVQCTNITYGEYTADIITNPIQPDNVPFQLLRGTLREGEVMYLSSVYLTYAATLDGIVDYRNIAEAKKYFCSHDSGGARWRPAFIKNRGYHMHFQNPFYTDAAISNSGIGSGIYDTTHNVNLTTVDMSRVLGESSVSSGTLTSKKPIVINLFSQEKENFDKRFNLSEWFSKDVIIPANENAFSFKVAKYVNYAKIHIPNVSGYRISCKLKKDFDEFFRIRGKNCTDAKVFNDSYNTVQANVSGNATSKDNLHHVYIIPKTLQSYLNKRTGLISIDI
jgi:hypothetical protein